jgi:RNA polymerase sigma-70 factor (ECF subfamily)
LSDRFSSERLNTVDPELWRLFQAGNEWAFGRLAQKHYRALYNYAGKFSSDPDFIRDCIQELFLELWHRRANLKETEFVKAYLLRALRHRIIKESFRLKRFQSHDEVPFEMAQPQTSIEHRIIADEAQAQQLKRLNAQLAGLSVRQREVIYLRFYQSMDNEEIARIMEMNRQSVANLMYRTLKELKQNMLVSPAQFCLLLSSLLTTGLTR